MGAAAREVSCGVDEWVNHGTLRLFGHMMRMDGGYFVKRMCEGSSEGGVYGGRPPVKRINIVVEYWRVVDWGLEVLE